MERYRIDVSLIQETKLQALTLNLSVGTVMAAAQDGTGWWFNGLHQPGHPVLCTILCNHQLMELLKIIIHLARRRRISITNVYLPPHSSGLSPNHQNDQSWLDYLPKEPDLVCEDFNAHHSSWDVYVSTDRRHFTTGYKHTR